LVLLVVGGFGTGRVSNRLTFDFALPGQSGYETAHRIEQLYGNGGEQAPSILVVSVPQGQTVDRDQARIATAIERLRRQQPRLRVVDYSATKDTRFVTRDGRSTWAFVFATKARGFGSTNYSKLAKRVLAQDLPAGYQLEATGLQELANNTSARGRGSSPRRCWARSGALAVLAFVFASFLALIPLLVAATPRRGSSGRRATGRSIRNSGGLRNPVS